MVGEDGDHVGDVAEPHVVGDDGEHVGDVVVDDGDHVGDVVGDDGDHVGDVVEPDVVGQRPPIDEDPTQLVHPTLTCNVRYRIRAMLDRLGEKKRRMENMVGSCFQKREPKRFELH